MWAVMPPRKSITALPSSASWSVLDLSPTYGRQVSYVLIPAQYGECGKDFKGRDTRVLLERPCRYVADFVYTDRATGQTVVEDTKGVRTKEYIIKRKLMLHVHGIRIKERSDYGTRQFCFLSQFL